MYIESVRQSISVKIHQHKYRFLAKRKNFSVLYFFGILLFFFFFFVVKSFSYSNFLTLDNGSAL